MKTFFRLFLSLVTFIVMFYLTTAITSVIYPMDYAPLAF